MKSRFGLGGVALAQNLLFYTSGIPEYRPAYHFANNGDRSKTWINARKLATRLMRIAAEKGISLITINVSWP
jgi:hypothetical protein